jgi:hypothetical protein
MSTTDPTYAPDYLKNPKPIDWSKPDTEAIQSNLMTWNQFQPSDKSGSSQCQAPQQLKSADIFASATDLAQKMGADAQCIKDVANDAGTRSKSSNFDERSSLDADYNARMNALIVSASVSASLSARNSKTTADQDSGTWNNQKSRSAGCGSTMITASNIAQKQLAMQCVINNVSQDTSIAGAGTASITIQTLPLTSEETAAKAALEAIQGKIIDNNNKNFATVTMLLFSKAKPDGTPFYSADELTKLLASLGKVYENQQDLMNKALTTYDRSIKITNTKVMNKVTSTVKVFNELSTSAKSDLATLSASVQKDLTAQTIANSMGVSAQDPNVKTMASKACESTSSSSSSSITNVLNSLKVSASASGKIVIVAAGTITLTGSDITNDITLKLATQAIMNQAIANSQSSAAQFMNDSANTQGIVNKVAGLETLQKELGTTVSDAIKANNEPIISSQNVDAKKSADYQNKVKDVVANMSNSNMYIVAAIVGVLLLVYLFKGSGSTAGGGSGGNRFRSYRFNRL